MDVTREGSIFDRPIARSFPRVVLWLCILLMGREVLAAIHPALDLLPFALLVAAFVLGVSLVAVRAGTAPGSTAMTLYMLYLPLAAVMSLARGVWPPAVLIGLLVAGFFLLFWRFAFSAAPTLTLDRFLLWNVWLSGLVSIIGLYQFFIDHSLFGVVDTIYGIESNATRRAVSVFGSPQVLGAYLAIMAAYLLVIRRSPAMSAILVLDLVTAVLSGNKALFPFFGVFLVAYVFLYRDRMDLRRVAPPAAFGFTVLAAFAAVSVTGRRVLEPIDFIVEGRLDRRVEIWARYLSPESAVSLWFGHGLGTAERIVHNVFGYGMDSAESYLIKLFYEIGLVGVAMFVLVYATAFVRAVRRDPRLAPIFAGFATNIVVVHTFAGIFMAFFFSAFLAWFLSARSLEARSPGRPVPGRPPRIATGSLK